MGDSPSRCAAVTTSAASPARTPAKRRLERPESRTGTGEHAPTTTPCVGDDRRPRTTRDRGHGHDRDHEVRPRAELRERARGGPVDRRARRRPSRARPAGGRSPVAGDERRQRHDPRAARRGRDLDGRVERQEVRRPVGGGRGVDDVARHGPRVLDLPAADLARRGPQPVERRRQRAASATSVQVVVAPIRQPPSGTRSIPRSPSTREMSSTGRSIGRVACAG